MNSNRFVRKLIINNGEYITDKRTYFNKKSSATTETFGDFEFGQRYRFRVSSSFFADTEKKPLGMVVRNYSLSNVYTRNENARGRKYVLLIFGPRVLKRIASTVKAETRTLNTNGSMRITTMYKNYDVKKTRRRLNETKTGSDVEPCVCVC